ncbi:MAG TPA: efflux RND transporter periplasmic adaptor subunit [Candidatus Acidoferrales bacterium]|nr:efflux RND transporter periplasmic adaptor subunit [Candidatus Acidoferrales bacterium]
MTTTTFPSPAGLTGAIRILGGLPRRWALAGLAALLILAIAIVATLRSHAGVAYATAPVTQGNLTETVTASGTVNPQNSISVGTEVSGTIASIGVDYNSVVKQGQVLARLDPSTFQAQLAAAEAALAQAKAQVAQADAGVSGAASGVDVADANADAQGAAVGAAQANVAKAQAALTLAQQTQQRDSALLAQGYVAQSTVDTDRSNTAQDQAAVASAQAAVVQARAQESASAATATQSGTTVQAQSAAAQAAVANVKAAQAAVEQDRLNLQHTVITSPVDGQVVARDVSVGQTVAASLQTPTLFTIAQDLGKMEIDINVGEPDIGNVKPGENVDFSVLAYPNRLFHGTVSQVRINPQTVNNVVTYDVVVLVPNTDGALLPGMTANATIDVATAKDALVVPLAALQFQPGANAAVATAASPWGAVQGTSATAAITAGSQGAVYVGRGARLTRVPVDVALTGETQAAIVPRQSGALAAGDRVVVAAATAAKRASAPAAAGAALRGMHP